MTEPLLEVRDLKVELALGRGVVHAVRGASFDVAPGEALGVVGESGSGKTMALRAIVGLLPRRGQVTGGTVAFEGEDLDGASADRLREIRGRSIAMIFQEPMTALNPVMRVGDQIAETPRVRLGQSRPQAFDRALELMRLVGIPDPARRDVERRAAYGVHDPAPERELDLQVAHLEQRLRHSGRRRSASPSANSDSPSAVITTAMPGIVASSQRVVRNV